MNKLDQERGRICLQCGGGNRAAARFCSKCGNPFTQHTQTLEEPATAESASESKPDQRSVSSQRPIDKTTSIFSQATLFAASHQISYLVSSNLNLASRHINFGNRLIVIDRRIEIPLFLLILVIASMLRIIGLEESPPGFVQDEVLFGLEALRIASGDFIGKWTIAALGNPSGHVHWLAIFMWLNGGEGDITVARLSSAIPSIGFVIVAYFLIRRLFGVPIALSSVALLAFSFFLLAQSRVTISEIHSIFMLLLSMLLLLISTERRNWILGAIAGLVLGLGVWVFKGYMAYYAPVLVIIALIVVVNRMWRRWELLAFLVMSLVAAYPILQIYWETGYLISNLRDQYEVDVGWMSLNPFQYISRTVEIILMVHNPIFENWSFGMPDIPLIDGIFFGIFRIFFWIGLAVSILSLKERRYQLLFLGWLIAAIPAILVPGGESRRYLLGIVFLLIFVSIGLHTVIALMVKYAWFNLRQVAWTKSWKLYYVTWFAVLTTAVMIGIFAVGERNRYHSWETSGNLRFAYAVGFIEMAKYLKSLEGDLEIRFYSARWSLYYEPREFLAPDAHGINGSEEFGGDGTIRSGGPIKDDTVFILADKYTSLVGELERTFPRGTVKYHFHRAPYQNDLAFVSYAVSPP